MKQLPYEQYKPVQKPVYQNPNINAYEYYKEETFFRKIRFWGFIAALCLVGAYAGYRIIDIYFFGG